MAIAICSGSPRSNDGLEPTCPLIYMYICMRRSLPCSLLLYKCGDRWVGQSASSPSCSVSIVWAPEVSQAPAQLLHACCSSDPGCDLTSRKVLDLVKQKPLVPEYSKMGGGNFWHHDNS
eukprot:scaffold7876_cov417-Prasinococcus_capsulatus_cf.AAC.5